MTGQDQISSGCRECESRDEVAEDGLTAIISDAATPDQHCDAEATMTDLRSATCGSGGGEDDAAEQIPIRPDLRSIRAAGI